MEWQQQLNIQERTFNTISSELHDNIAQLLSLAKVQLNIIKERQHHSPEMLDQVNDHINRAMTDLRDIAHGLSGERIRTRPLSASIKEEIQRINKTDLLRATLHSQGTEPPIAGEKKLTLFRIMQECIHNCIKHAGASELQLKLAFMDEGIEGCVSDNGTGFDVQQMMNRSNGIGLLTMHQRARLAGGAIRIDSQPQTGTRININIPYA